jgi:hypothetical protein
MNRYDVLLKKSLPQEELPKNARVRTLKSLHDDQYTSEALKHRKWGAEGIVVGSHNSHGLCYDVRHLDDSIGCYDPDELKSLDQQCKHKFCHDSGHRFKCIYCNLVVNSLHP